jgi:hypothetical protein
MKAKNKPRLLTAAIRKREHSSKRSSTPKPMGEVGSHRRKKIEFFKYISHFLVCEGI